MTKRRLTRVAKEAYLHAGEYAFHGRKNRKRDFRRLWISRISEAVQENGLSYNVFINKLKKADIQIDRKMLSILVSEYPDQFINIIDEVRQTN